MDKNKLENAVQQGTNTAVSILKNRMFDFIAVGILIAMLALNLGVIELRDITLLNIANILLECVPFFITSVLLSVNFYHKGTYTGKNTANFIATSKQYSKMVVDLTGEEIEVLPDFCSEFNDNVIKQMQTNLLKRASITYEKFNDEFTDENGNIIQPLKVMSKKQLLTMYSKERVKIILLAKKVKIKGLNENLLLGNNNVEDITDMGDDEQTMDRDNTRDSASIYLISTILLALIGVKDVLEWGWAGLLITAFKLIYVLCSSYMKHFKGYNDVTIRLSNHIARKTDILKQFKHWCTTKLNKESNN